MDKNDIRKVFGEFTEQRVQVEEEKEE